jgi:hypothetical protein
MEKFRYRINIPDPQSTGISNNGRTVTPDGDKIVPLHLDRVPGLPDPLLLQRAPVNQQVGPGLLWALLYRTHLNTDDTVKYSR